MPVNFVPIQSEMKDNDSCVSGLTTVATDESVEGLDDGSVSLPGT